MAMTSDAVNAAQRIRHALDEIIGDAKNLAKASGLDPHDAECAREMYDQLGQSARRFRQVGRPADTLTRTGPQG